MDLIIVESPTKAKTLSRFLGKDYEVEATKGHIKDLPKSPISVDIEDNFKPEYRVVPGQQKTINALKRAAKKATHIYLATDPDREGEAISAHAEEVITDKIKEKGKLKRIVFHEITKEAVEEAIAHPRSVDNDLVDAQVARRVLDRLVGYKLSPLLWKKVRRGLSAGRVQSVAVRLIVEREREIKAFKPVEYWEIGAQVSKDKGKAFVAGLTKIDGKKAEIGNKKEADIVISDLKKANYKVENVVRREVKKAPYPPFTTSTMTQAAANLFGWSAKRTMSVAQKLYEEGLITYHRTDSVNLSSQALDRARGYINDNFGKEYLPDNARIYKTKAKSAQEAHEAIRPTDPSTVYEPKKAKYSGDNKKLYELIWKRFIACQMKESVYDQTTIDVSALRQAQGKHYLLRASGQIMKFDGWRKVMPLGKSTENGEMELPQLAKNDPLDLKKVLSEQKFTQPPARYNEASIIKTLEKLGIGRPSTYAPIISTIQSRAYVEKKEGRFFATPVGMAVTEFLMKNFPDTLDYAFTAKMEGDLDRVAEGKVKWQKEIGEFWKPFDKKLKEVEEKSERVKIETEKLGKKCPECKEGELVIRVGRFGKFISCSRFPECKYTAAFMEKVNMKCPKCGKGEVVVKKTGKGRQFFGCSKYPDCDFASWKNPKLEKTKKLDN